MSDTWLRYVPLSPDAQPTPEAAERAVALAETLFPGAFEVTADFEDAVTPFHPGVLWQGVACPSCGADAEGWFDEAVEAASSGGFQDLGVTTPCCSTKTTLNDLAYVAPIRFGRFALTILNPDVAEPTEAQDSQIAEALGLPVMKVWTHL